MQIQPEYKTLNMMSDAELAHIVHIYKLHKLYELDIKLNTNVNFTEIERDLIHNRERIEGLATWRILIEILHDTFKKAFLLQIINLSLMVSCLVLGNLLSLLIPFLLPSIVLAIALSLFILSNILLLLFSASLRVQSKMDDEFKTPQPKMKNQQVLYDVNIVSPGEKIWRTLSYKESIYVLFSQCKFQANNSGYSLCNRQRDVCKDWDIEGNLARGLV